MSWTIARLPNFVAQDSGLMVAELIAFQITAMRRGVTNQAAYEEVYARVFGGLDPQAWVRLPPATIAEGITTIVREVGLFVLRDDDVALGVLQDETVWETQLPAVKIARIENDEPVYTPSRRQQLVNRQAITDLVQRAALLAYCERLPSVRIDTLTRAIAMQASVATMFDGVIDEASARNDGTARTLRQIKATAMVLLDQRAGPVRDEGVLNLAASLPSLVVAHFAYREARQMQRIRNANPTAHPNFMPQQLIIPPWP